MSLPLAPLPTVEQGKQKKSKMPNFGISESAHRCQRWAAIFDIDRQQKKQCLHQKTAG